MAEQLRFHDEVLRERLSRARTAFVSGPHQVGKTTSCRALSHTLLDWNDLADRLIIARGPDAVARHLGLEQARERPTIVIDNLHGHRDWKRFLRRFNARYGTRLRLIVTTLDAAVEPGSRLPPNSFLLRFNPWSVGECVRTVPADSPVKAPAAIGEEDWAALLEHGGFPEPFAKRDPRFTRSWQAQRREELIERDLPGLAAVRDFVPVQMLALILSERSATPLIHSGLGRELGVSSETLRRWIDLLVGLQYGFRVRPWFTGVPKALRKEPKWFLRDWSAVADPAARRQTFIACHLLKAVEGWTDLGFGRFELRYVRDKLRREVDFLVLRDRRPWFLVEVADSETVQNGRSTTLGFFQQCTRARHAFRVQLHSPYSAADCFAHGEPTIVSARTLLSQLL